QRSPGGLTCRAYGSGAAGRAGLPRWTASFGQAADPNGSTAGRALHRAFRHIDAPADVTAITVVMSCRGFHIQLSQPWAGGPACLPSYEKENSDAERARGIARARHSAQRSADALRQRSSDPPSVRCQSARGGVRHGLLLGRGTALLAAAWRVLD